MTRPHVPLPLRRSEMPPAAQNGLRTAHIARPGENGPGTGENAPRVPVDVAASSMEDLARQLGV